MSAFELQRVYEISDEALRMQVMEVFQEMVYKGCERSVITYSSLISACEKARPALPTLHPCVLLKHVGLLHAQKLLVPSAQTGAQR